MRPRFALTRPEINDASFIQNLAVSPAGPLIRPLSNSCLQRFEIFDKLARLLVGQPQGEVFVVMVDHILEGRKAPVVVEATFLMCKEPFERRRPVMLVG